MLNSNSGSDLEENVFEFITEPVENVQDYVPGGRHPVYLGDVVGDGRYKIIRKLGYGGYSTVWLAQKVNKDDSCMALKVTRADANVSNEIELHEVLRTRGASHPGLSCIVMLKDNFSIHGPNGEHSCVAYEVMGPSIGHVRDDTLLLNSTTYFTLSAGRNIIYRILLALDCMHSIGLVHGDLYEENVLLTVRDLSCEPKKLLEQPQNQITANVNRIHGSKQPGDPRYLTYNCPLDHLISEHGHVKLSDLGNSFFEGKPPGILEMPSEIRSPEILFDGNISAALDCWALGCLLYNLFTNRPLFELSFIYNKNARDDAHILQMWSLLGPLPELQQRDWPRYSKYFDDKGQLQNFNIDDDTMSYPDLDSLPEKAIVTTTSDISDNCAGKIESGVFSASLSQNKGKENLFDPKLYPILFKICERKDRDAKDDPQTVEEYKNLYPPLRERWMHQKHTDLSSEESEDILDLLQRLLTYDLNQRLTTRQILQHAWIRKFCAF